MACYKCKAPDDDDSSTCHDCTNKGCFNHMTECDGCRNMLCEQHGTKTGGRLLCSAHF